MTLSAFVRLLPLCISALLFCASPAAEEMPAPPGFVTEDPNWDWVRLGSGEWLKGELLSLERDSLDFDSDVLGEVSLDWDDISDMYTQRAMAVLLGTGHKAYGQIRMQNGKALIGAEPATHEQILRIAPGAPRKLDLWRGSVSAGLTLRDGNYTQRDVSTAVRLTRRTAQSTFRTTFTGNYTEDNQVASADNQRANAIYEYRLGRKWYLQPLRGEYYRDEFQNISAQWSAGFGASYYAFETSSLLWTISAGPGYQKTQYSEVPEGEDSEVTSGFFMFSTVYDHEITSSIDIYSSYRVTKANEESGGITQNFVLSLDVDLLDDLSLNVSTYVDRIQEPQEDANGVTPRNSDVRLTVGLSYDF